MHPVNRNAQNKGMGGKGRRDVNLSQRFEDCILFRHWLKQKCINWNQNCSDRRWNQAAPPHPALTLKPPGCSAELLSAASRM